MSTPAERKLKRKKKKQKFLDRPATTGLQAQPLRQQPRSAFKPASGSSTTTGFEQQEQQGGGGGGLLGMLALKKGWDEGQQVQEGITSGAYADKFENAWDKIGNYAGDVTTGLNDFMTGTNTLTDISQLPAQGMDLYGGTTGARWDLLGGPTPMNAGVSGFSVPSAPMFEAGNMMPVGNEMLGATHNFAMPVDQFALEGSTQLVVDPLTGLQTSTIGDAASAAEASMLAKGGALAGLGLNAYDIANQGITANNAMGLLGSGIMAGTTMLGLSNAWNPLGWALLGGSAIGGLTDWW